MLLEPVEGVRPARLVQGEARLGRKRRLVDHHAGPAGVVEKGELDDRRTVVGIRLLPFEAVDQAPRRIDLEELSAEVERRGVGRLHLDAIRPAHPEIEVDARGRKAGGPPPAGESIRLDTRVEGISRRHGKHPLQVQPQRPGCSTHVTIVRRAVRRAYGLSMDDAGIHESIEQLVAEEHELWDREAAGSATEADRGRLQDVKVSLDRCWDLLRQRRALEEFGFDADAATARSEETVEGYEQ